MRGPLPRVIWACSHLSVSQRKAAPREAGLCPSSLECGQPELLDQEGHPQLCSARSPDDTRTVLLILTLLGPPSAPWQMLETPGLVCLVYGLETTL